MKKDDMSGGFKKNKPKQSYDDAEFNERNSRKQENKKIKTEIRNNRKNKLEELKNESDD
jgi:hypothetical protein